MHIIHIHIYSHYYIYVNMYICIYIYIYIYIHIYIHIHLACTKACGSSSIRISEFNLQANERTSARFRKAEKSGKAVVIYTWKKFRVIRTGQACMWLSPQHAAIGTSCIMHRYDRSSHACITSYIVCASRYVCERIRTCMQCTF